MENIISKERNENVFYRVQKNDTISSVAHKLNVDESYILKFNNIQNNEIFEGDVLYLENTNVLCHIVGPLDTLTKIAQKYHTTEKEILQKNQIDVLFIGQKIYL